MLKLPVQKKTRKAARKESSFEAGMVLIQGNLQKQATKEFINAIKQNPANMLEKLQSAFTEYYNTRQYENAIAIGEALLHTGNVNSDFLVNLGNSYRQLSDSRKANRCYLQALRADKSNQLAHYNLAASLAKVNKYDQDISKSLDLFNSLNGPVLPGYLNDPEILEKISNSLEQEKEHLSQKIEALIEEKEKQRDAGNVEAVKNLIHKIETEERKLSSSDYEATCKKLKQAFKKNWARQTIEETKRVFQENQFNLALYAFSQGDRQLVSETLQKLNAEKNDLKNMDLLTSLYLDLQGSTEEAIAALTAFLKKRPNDRYANANLGLLYRKTGNLLQADRYLIKASDLLEKSEGLYCLDEIESRADEYYENGDFMKACKLYQLISEENPTVSALLKLGDIQVKQGQLTEATISFNEIKELDPRNEEADHKLMQIHELYYQKADTASRNGYYQEAITLYQNALEIHKSAEVINRIIRIYEKLNDFSQINSLKTEIEKLEAVELKKKQEQQRNMLVEKGKDLMKNKQFDKAIELLEKAFELKPDRDVFLLLAHIFKGLNQQRRLSSLMKQWHDSKDRLENDLDEH